MAEGVFKIKNADDIEKLQEEASIIYENIEDVVEYICDEHMLSGEKVWVMINALSVYHLGEFPSIEEEE